MKTNEKSAVAPPHHKRQHSTAAGLDAVACADIPRELAHRGRLMVQADAASPQAQPMQLHLKVLTSHSDDLKTAVDYDAMAVGTFAVGMKGFDTATDENYELVSLANPARPVVKNELGERFTYDAATGVFTPMLYVPFALPAPPPPVFSTPTDAPGDRQTYPPGRHGAKKREQGRLSKAPYHLPVTGTTHESEHPIGFEPIYRSGKGKRGKSKRAKRIENTAPAYQEVNALHRDHIGTGTHGAADASGFDSDSYRASQRALLEAQTPGVAIQINQLPYAFDPRFRHDPALPNVPLEQANDSFAQMVSEVDSFQFANDYTDPATGMHVERDQLVRFDSGDALEMLASRATAQLGRYLSSAEVVFLGNVQRGAITFNDYIRWINGDPATKAAIEQKVEDAVGDPFA